MARPQLVAVGHHALFRTGRMLDWAGVELGYVRSDRIRQESAGTSDLGNGEGGGSGQVDQLRSKLSLSRLK